MIETLNNATPKFSSRLLKQRGVVVPIVAIGLLALLAIAGLALDASHALANKTRMQNTVDAAALAAAKVLDLTEKRGDADAAARSLFSINAGGAGNNELGDAVDRGEILIIVEFSETVSPFTPDPSVPGPFVRVIATGFDTQTTLSRVLGIDDIPTPATAVAGPSGPIGLGEGAQICDVAPIAVCEGDVPVDDTTTPNVNEAQDALRVLKPAPADHNDIGPGNYKLLRITGPGQLRDNMAGSSDVCATIGEIALVDTEPGVNSGPVSQGFNTRFDEQKGGLSKPPYYPDEYIEEQGPNFLKSCQYVPDDDDEDRIDFIFLTTPSGGPSYCKDFGDEVGFNRYVSSTWGDPWADDYVQYADEINYNYCNYSKPKGTDCNDLTAPNPASGPGDRISDGIGGRRILNFPVVACDGLKNGLSEVEILYSACFFMLQSLPVGQSDGAGQIFGQYLSKCNVNGTPGIDPGDPGSSSLLYKIQLYKNPDSGDS